MSENAAEDVYVNMRCEECANRATGVKDQCPAGGCPKNRQEAEPYTTFGGWSRRAAGVTVVRRALRRHRCPLQPETNERR